MSKFTLLIFCIITTGLLSSCDIDLLGLDKKYLAPNYTLDYFAEGQSYYVRDKRLERGNGVFDGIVKRIGTNHRFIVADIQKCFGGDIDGIYVLEISSGKIKGPISDSEMATLTQSEGISLEDVAVFYAK